MVWGIGSYFGAHIVKKMFGCFENFRHVVFPLNGRRKYFRKKEMERNNVL